MDVYEQNRKLGRVSIQTGTFNHNNQCFVSLTFVARSKAVVHFSADWQLKLLDSSTNMDQLFMYG